MITIYVFLFALGLKDCSMDISLNNLYNKKSRYDHHTENQKRSIIEDESLYGLQIDKKPGIQVISLEFLEKWNSVQRNAERQLIELLLTKAKVVSKKVEEKFERK